MNHEVPIAVGIVAHRRPDHLRNCLESLRRNPEFARTAVTVYVDGPRTDPEAELTAQVAEVVEGFDSAADVRAVRRAENLGLARSVILAVDSQLARHESVIMLEDDLVVSPHFLRFMNEAMRRYRDDRRVASVHGYVYPVDRALPETFFLRGADCLGWGTWRRAWEMFEPDATTLQMRMEQMGAEAMEDFNFGGSYPYSRMLERQASGQADSWAIRWYASAFVEGMLTLYPARSLVVHAGGDGSGTNVGTTDVLDVELSDQPVLVTEISVEESAQARAAFEAYFRRVRPKKTASGRGPRVRLCDILRRLRARLRLRTWTKRLLPGVAFGARQWKVDEHGDRPGLESAQDRAENP
jgi:hypothetical protein